MPDLAVIQNYKVWYPCSISKHNTKNVGQLFRSSEALEAIDVYGAKMEVEYRPSAPYLEWILDFVVQGKEYHVEQISADESGYLGTDLRPNHFNAFHNGLWIPTANTFRAVIPSLILSLRVEGFLLDTWILEKARLIMRQDDGQTLKVIYDNYKYCPVELEADFSLFNGDIFANFYSRTVLLGGKKRPAEEKQQMLDFFYQHPKEFLLQRVRHVSRQSERYRGGYTDVSRSRNYPGYSVNYS